MDFSTEEDGETDQLHNIEMMSLLSGLCLSNNVWEGISSSRNKSCF